MHSLNSLSIKLSISFSQTGQKIVSRVLIFFSSWTEMSRKLFFFRVDGSRRCDVVVVFVVFVAPSSLTDWKKREVPKIFFFFSLIFGRRAFGTGDKKLNDMWFIGLSFLMHLVPMVLNHLQQPLAIELIQSIGHSLGKTPTPTIMGTDKRAFGFFLKTQVLVLDTQLIF